MLSIEPIREVPLAPGWGPDARSTRSARASAATSSLLRSRLTAAALLLAPPPLPTMPAHAGSSCGRRGSCGRRADSGSSQRRQPKSTAQAARPGRARKTAEVRMWAALVSKKGSVASPSWVSTSSASCKYTAAGGWVGGCMGEQGGRGGAAEGCEGRGWAATSAHGAASAEHQHRHQLPALPWPSPRPPHIAPSPERAHPTPAASSSARPPPAAACAWSTGRRPARAAAPQSTCGRVQGGCRRPGVRRVQTAPAQSRQGGSGMVPAAAAPQR